MIDTLIFGFMFAAGVATFLLCALIAFFALYFIACCIVGIARGIVNGIRIVRSRKK